MNWNWKGTEEVPWTLDGEDGGVHKNGKNHQPETGNSHHGKKRT